MSKPVRLLLVVCLFCAAPAVPASGQSAPAKNARLARLMTSAQTLYDEGRYKEAGAVLAQLRALAPAYPGFAELSKRVEAAVERERLSLYRAAAFTDDSGAGARPTRPLAPAPDITVAAAENMLGKAAAAPGLRGDSRRLYERAEELLDKGLYDGARRVLAEIAPGDKEFDRARILRARIDAWEALAHRRGTPGPGQRALMAAGLRKKLDKDLATARLLFSAGKWRETIDACEKMRRYAPDDPRVRRLMQDATIELTDVRVNDIEARAERRMREVIGETEDIMTPPDKRPKLTRPKPEPDVRIPSADELELEKKLNEKVSIDLIEAPLSYVLDLLARSVGINIIVDPAAVQDKTVTVNVQNTTLKELLDFITRNEGVSFTRGRNTIYVTTPDQPMLTMRIFRLSKGLTDVGWDITPQGAANIQGGAGGASGGRQPRQQQQQQAQSPGAKPSDTSDIEKLLEQLPMLIDWPTGSTYYLDRKRNVLFLRSTPETLDKVEKMIEALDENPIQVLVTTRFIEIDAEAFHDIGVNWNLTNDYALSKEGGSNKLVVDASTGTVFDPRVSTEALDVISAADGLTFGLTGILTEPQFQMTLKTVMARYKGRVVNAPRIIAMNNSPARFQETEDLWYVEDYEDRRTDLTGSEGVTSSEPAFVPIFVRGPSIGFGLTVTPSVGKDSRDITLLLEPIFRRKSIDSVTSPLILPGDLEPVSIERPVIIDRRMWAKVTVRDGYHVVLGGMVSASKKHYEAKVPILGDIPLLGWLFKRQTTKDVRKHLLIFVSAKILHPTGSEYKTEDEEKDEAEKRNELLRGTALDPDLPEGLGLKWMKNRETRQILGPDQITPAETDVIELREVGSK